MITAIVIVLIMNNSLLSLLVPLIVALICVGIIKLFKKWTNWAGQLRQKAEARRMQLLKESYASILEIKIYNAEQYFSKLFSKEEHDLKRVGVGVLTMAEIPKPVLELLGVLVIFLFFLITYSFDNTENLLVSNGLFAVAIIKLLPSINKIILAYNSMRVATPAFLDVAEVFSNSVKNKNIINSKEQKSTFGDISSIKIKNLVFSYKTNEAPLVKDINISMKKGFIYGLIGPSGSGKTTILNVISGVLILKNSSTQFFINGKKIKHYSKEVKNHIGYVPQSPQLFNRSIKENVAFDQNPDLIETDRVIDALIAAEAMSFVNELENGIECVLSDGGMNLSGGQRQRLALARVLYRQPSVIIFDEATNALDQNTIDQFMKTIRDLSKRSIMIIVSHSDEMINFCDKILTIKNRT